MHFLNVFLAFVSFASFSWGASKYFKSDDKDAKKGKLIITVFGLPSMIITLFLLYKVTEFSFVSALLYLISIFLFWKSISTTKAHRFNFAYSSESPSVIVKSGPYKYVRHPFYLSYTLAWIAGFIATQNILLFLIAAIMFGLYFISAAKEEKVILSSNLGSEFAIYKKSTGMFFPKLIK